MCMVLFFSVFGAVNFFYMVHDKMGVACFL